MNKKQWYVWGAGFSIGFLLSSTSIMANFERLRIFEDNIWFAIHMGINFLLFMVCAISAVACFICGWLEKEEAE